MRRLTAPDREVLRVLMGKYGRPAIRAEMDQPREKKPAGTPQKLVQPNAFLSVWVYVEYWRTEDAYRKAHLRNRTVLQACARVAEVLRIATAAPQYVGAQRLKKMHWEGALLRRDNEELKSISDNALSALIAQAGEAAAAGGEILPFPHIFKYEGGEMVGPIIDTFADPESR